MNGNGIMNLYEHVDILKEMGEFIPNDIAAIVSNQTTFDVQDWLCKKMFARPMNQHNQRKRNNVIN
jgi:hypothetical protein